MSPFERYGHRSKIWRRRICSLIGGGLTAPDRTAFYNNALVRYLDFNDSYLAKGETCPSDNVGAGELGAFQLCVVARL
jgi:2-methylcitrate dehydratase